MRENILEGLQEAADYFSQFYNKTCTRENIRQYVSKGRLKPFKTMKHGKKVYYQFTKVSIEGLK
jgi:hypothetical protein